ncbi:MAG: PKD domain-containing protein, partial [Crocinitomicaceae bacterium]
INVGTISSWNWNFGDGGTSDLQNPQYTYLLPGMFDVQLTVSSNEGCSHDTIVSVYITAYPSAEAAIVQDFTEVTAGEAVTFDNLSSNATSWFWDFGDGSTSTEESPIHTYQSSGNFTVLLVAMNEYGCNDSVSYTLLVNSEITLFAPNACTPDENEFNQSWVYYISGIDESAFDLQMFNRWGELVWSSNTPNESWDVSSKGTIVQDGTYTWKMSCKSKMNGEIKVFVGHVNILR